MRKGFSLIEILAVLVVLSVMSIALARLFKAVIKDVPRSYRVIETNTTLLNILQQMHKDIDAARQLPESFGEYDTNEQLLLIELADGVVCYQLKEDEVIRRRLTNVQKDNGEERTVWSVPNTKIEWRVWRKDNKGYAVEVKTHIEQIVRTQWRKKLANSHLYFVGCFGEALK